MLDLSYLSSHKKHKKFIQDQYFLIHILNKLFNYDFMMNCLFMQILLNFNCYLLKLIVKTKYFI